MATFKHVHEDKVFGFYYGSGLGLSFGTESIQDLSDGDYTSGNDENTYITPLIQLMAGRHLNVFDIFFMEFGLTYELSLFYHRIKQNNPYPDIGSLTMNISIGNYIY